MLSMWHDHDFDSGGLHVGYTNTHYSNLHTAEIQAVGLHLFRCKHVPIVAYVHPNCHVHNTRVAHNLKRSWCCAQFHAWPTWVCSLQSELDAVVSHATQVKPPHNKSSCDDTARTLPRHPVNLNYHAYLSIHQENSAYIRMFEGLKGMQDYPLTKCTKVETNTNRQMCASSRSLN